MRSTIKGQGRTPWGLTRGEPTWGQGEPFPGRENLAETRGMHKHWPNKDEELRKIFQQRKTRVGRLVLSVMVRAIRGGYARGMAKGREGDSKRGQRGRQGPDHAGLCQPR